MLFLNKTLTSSDFACKEVICVDSSNIVCSAVSPQIQIHTNSYEIAALFNHIFSFFMNFFCVYFNSWTVKHVLHVC